MRRVRLLRGVSVNCDDEFPLGFPRVLVLVPLAPPPQSVSMSNWTMEEVNELKAENGGGNDRCRRTWLSGCPRSEALAPGDPIDKIKAFVIHAYERGAYANKAPPPASIAATNDADASPMRVVKGPWGPGGTLGTPALLSSSSSTPAAAVQAGRPSVAAATKPQRRPNARTPTGRHQTQVGNARAKATEGKTRNSATEAEPA